MHKPKVAGRRIGEECPKVQWLNSQSLFTYLEAEISDRKITYFAQSWRYR
jgi:hypothetical protein